MSAADATPVRPLGTTVGASTSLAVMQRYNIGSVFKKAMVTASF